MWSRENIHALSIWKSSLFLITDCTNIVYSNYGKGRVYTKWQISWLLIQGYAVIIIFWKPLYFLNIFLSTFEQRLNKMCVIITKEVASQNGKFCDQDALAVVLGRCHIGNTMKMQYTCIYNVMYQNELWTTHTSNIILYSFILLLSVNYVILTTYQTLKDSMKGFFLHTGMLFFFYKSL